MNIETQIVITTIVAMIGIVGMPLYVFWWFWRKSGKSMEEKQHQHQH